MADSNDHKNEERLLFASAYHLSASNIPLPYETVYGVVGTNVNGESVINFGNKL